MTFSVGISFSVNIILLFDQKIKDDLLQKNAPEEEISCIIGSVDILLKNVILLFMGK